MSLFSTQFNFYYCIHLHWTIFLRDILYLQCISKYLNAGNFYPNFIPNAWWITFFISNQDITISDCRIMTSNTKWSLNCVPNCYLSAILFSVESFRCLRKYITWTVAILYFALSLPVCQMLIHIHLMPLKRVSFLIWHNIFTRFEIISEDVK